MKKGIIYFPVLAEREVKDPGKPDPLPEAAEKIRSTEQSMEIHTPIIALTAHG